MQLLSLHIEMPLLNWNKRLACFVCGRENSRWQATSRRKRCGVSKGSNWNFDSDSSDEVNVHIEKKRSLPVYSCCQNGFINLLDDCMNSEQSPKVTETFQEKKIFWKNRKTRDIKHWEKLAEVLSCVSCYACIEE